MTTIVRIFLENIYPLEELKLLNIKFLLAGQEAAQPRLAGPQGGGSVAPLCLPSSIQAQLSPALAVYLGSGMKPRLSVPARAPCLLPACIYHLSGFHGRTWPGRGPGPRRVPPVSSTDTAQLP